MEEQGGKVVETLVDQSNGKEIVSTREVNGNEIKSVSLKFFRLAIIIEFVFIYFFVRKENCQMIAKHEKYFFLLSVSFNRIILRYKSIYLYKYIETER